VSRHVEVVIDACRVAPMKRGFAPGSPLRSEARPRRDAPIPAMTASEAGCPRRTFPRGDCRASEAPRARGGNQTPDRQQRDRPPERRLDFL
jgi:hypothetical protein